MAAASPRPAACTNAEPAPGEEESAAGAAAKIKEEEVQVRKVQDWWGSEPNGPATASSNSILACLDPPLLSEVIAAGGGYHSILSADRLDGLHRQYGSGTDPSLEPLRKALQARGGSKAQARALGMLLFKEARSLLEQGGITATAVAVGSVATPARAAAARPGPGPVGSPGAQVAAPAASGSPLPSARGGAVDVKLDEMFAPPRRYVCSEVYPAGALMAARAAPSGKSEMVARLPSDFAYSATGRVGDYLEVQVNLNDVPSKAYVLHTIADQVMLVPAAPVVALDEVFSPPCRWVKAAGYPEGAQMAAKIAPSRESTQIATLPPDFDYLATGRAGDFLQIVLDLDGASVSTYVLHQLGDLVLLVPDPASAPLPPPPAREQPQHAEPEQSQSQRAADAAAAARAAAEAAERAAAAARAVSDVRVEALEAKVASQEQQLKALQAEVGLLRAQLASAAAAFMAASGGGGGGGGY